MNNWNDLANLEDKNFQYFITHLNVICEFYNMFFKKSCFKDENEYRFIFSFAHDGGYYAPTALVPLNFRIKDELLIPYVKCKLKNMESLKGVLVGSKNNNDIAFKGVEYFLRKHQIDIPIKISELPLRY